MKVSYSKDLANHANPEPHGVCGNAIADALVWESVGGTLSSENTTIRVPTLWSEGEGHIFHSAIASYERTWRSLSILACAEALCAGIGRSERDPASENWNGRIQPTKISRYIEMDSFRCKRRTRKRSKMLGGAGEGQKPYFLYQILLGSRTQHSTVEAGEQGENSTPAEPVEGRT